MSRGFLRPLDLTLCCACVGRWPGAGQFCLRFGCCGGVVGVAVMGGLASWGPSSLRSW